MAIQDLVVLTLNRMLSDGECQCLMNRKGN